MLQTTEYRDAGEHKLGLEWTEDHSLDGAEETRIASARRSIQSIHRGSLALEPDQLAQGSERVTLMIKEDLLDDLRQLERGLMCPFVEDQSSMGAERWSGRDETSEMARRVMMGRQGTDKPAASATEDVLSSCKSCGRASMGSLGENGKMVKQHRCRRLG